MGSGLWPTNLLQLAAVKSKTVNDDLCLVSLYLLIARWLVIFFHSPVAVL